MGELIQIGVILKAHGVRGVMKAAVEPFYIGVVPELEAIFIKTAQNEILPFFIETAEVISGETVLLKLEDISGREQVAPLIQSGIMVREEDLDGVAVEEDSWIGFLIIDTTLGEIGKIQDILEMPQQDLAKVLHDTKELLIPLHEDLIDKVDEKNQKIFMNLPEGLTEVF